MWLTVEEHERRIGAQVRERRLRANRTMKGVAESAGLSLKTVQNLEHGRGSTLTTLIRVLRSLDAEDWLESLTPNELASPIAILEAARATPQRRRASRADA